MKIKPVHTRLFTEGENLERFVLEHIPKLMEASVLVVTSKIVALAECRTATLQEKERIIREESEWSMPTKHALLTIRDGMCMTSAGIDESNADERIILLPKDSFKVASRLQRALRKHYKVKELGVLITDSRVLPLRAGTIGVALGYAGFAGIKDYRGSVDLFGRVLKMTRVNVADSLATAAVLLMGEGNERIPLARIDDAPVRFVTRVNRQELVIPMADDVYMSTLVKPDSKKVKRKR